MGHKRGEVYNKFTFIMKVLFTFRLTLFSGSGKPLDLSLSPKTLLTPRRSLLTCPPMRNSRRPVLSSTSRKV